MRALCGTACHRYPPPDILPRSEWREEIAKMTLFRQGNPVPPGPPGTLSRIVALPPDMERVLRFYVAHAPEELPAPEAWPAVDSASKVVFERRAFAPERASKTPSVSNVRFADLDRDGKLEIVATEMSYGYVMGGSPPDRQAQSARHRRRHPAPFALGHVWTWTKTAATISWSPTSDRSSPATISSAASRGSAAWTTAATASSS